MGLSQTQSEGLDFINKSNGFTMRRYVDSVAPWPNLAVVDTKQLMLGTEMASYPQE